MVLRLVREEERHWVALPTQSLEPDVAPAALEMVKAPAVALDRG